METSGSVTQPRRPEIFISAASADLRSARVLLKTVLDTIGCHGVRQEEFPPDYRQVAQMLRSRLKKCDAVIHVVGICYGAEPTERPQGVPRRSFTQIEYDIAREIGKPMYVFVCEESYPFDAHALESTDISRLQQEHRNLCLSQKEIRERVSTPADLKARVSQLREPLLSLERQILETRKDLVSATRASLRAKLTLAMDLHARDEVKEARSLIEEVYHHARAEHLETEALEAVISLAFASSVRDDFKAVRKRLREAGKLIRGIDSPWHLIQYHRLKAKVLLHQKNLAQAEKELLRAIALIGDKQEDVLHIGLMAHADYIHLLCAHRRTEEALPSVDMIRAFLEKRESLLSSPFIAAIAEACIHWAIAAENEELVNRFVQHAIGHGSGKEAAIPIAHALHDCANGARGMGQPTFSVACAEAAARLGRIAERGDISFAAEYTAAAVFIDKKDFKEAYQRCLVLLETGKALQESKLKFGMFHLLSMASRQIGDRTTAVEAAQEALRDAEGDITAICLSKMVLAEALRDSGKAKEAMQEGDSAYVLSADAHLPHGFVEQLLDLLIDCASILAEWNSAEDYLERLRAISTVRSHSKDHIEASANRIRFRKAIHEACTTIVNEEMPLSAARTEGAGSVQDANAMLVKGVIDAWKEYPNAASIFYDYWGRGNLTRAMLNMHAFPGILNMTIGVHTVDEARRAIRLWGLIADVLVLIWKGPTVSTHVVCPVPLSFGTAGGGGYFASQVVGRPTKPEEVTGLANTGWSEDMPEDAITPIIMARHTSLLPPEVGRFLAREALELVAQGRLIVVPATGIGCVGAGHGPIETLFAKACNAIPAIKGEATTYPASLVPYFPDVPLDALAEVALQYSGPLRRFRIAIMRKSRQFIDGSSGGYEAKQLELELNDALAEMSDSQSTLRRKYGWGEAHEPMWHRYDGFSCECLTPVFVLKSMGYRWRIEYAPENISIYPEHLPKTDEPICSWLHPADTHVEMLSKDQIQRIQSELGGKVKTSRKSRACAVR